jgi:formylglycine-generating enzyme required for sulfatase activity
MSDWIEIPGGTFLVGVTREEALALARTSIDAMRTLSEEDPDLLHMGVSGGAEGLQVLVRLLMGALQAHPVELAPYRIGRVPVLNGDYKRFVDATGRKPPIGWKFPKGSDPARPVVGCSWQDASDYAAWAGARLPTEAEWERAARGEQRQLFPWGNQYLPTGRLLEGHSMHVREVPGTIPGLISPDGVHDMVTRHWEWTADVMAPYPTADIDIWNEMYPQLPSDYRSRRGGVMEQLVPSAIGREGSPAALPHPEASFRLAR